MDQKHHNIEQRNINIPPSRPGEEKKPDQLKLFREGKEAVAGKVAEIAEGLEEHEAGFETGEIAETIREDKKGAPPAGYVPVKKPAKPIAKTVKPIVIPTVEVMQKQVAHAVKIQIRILETEAREIISNPMKFEPFALNKIVAKIRELKEILALITHAAFDLLKGWWLKYVNGAGNS